MFDLHSKDGSDIISAAGTAVLIKFKSLSSQENYIVSVYYYANYLLNLYFQIQFIKVSRTLDGRNRIKNSI